ncbi:MAG: HAD family phosphatase [Acidobacteria bacterium]|nr:HAD family phosphatase [Acidobacteriota bacterium]
MKIGLLALDIDGTLLNAQFQVSEANRRAIQEVIAQGVLVVLVTGRRFVIAQPIARELELATPLVSHNGALTKNTQTLEVIDYHPLAASLARRTVEMGREVKADLVCCYDPVGYGRAVFEAVSEQNVRLRRYLERAPMVVEQVHDLWTYIEEDPIQVMSSGPCALMAQFEEVLASHLAGKVTLLKTAYPLHDMTILDIIAPQCSKGAAVAAVVARYGLSREEVMAIGDNHNDLEMLEFAGLGVVMGNAEQRVKSLGYHITGSNDEDGVAEAIRRFILKR